MRPPRPRDRTDRLHFASLLLRFPGPEKHLSVLFSSSSFSAAAQSFEGREGLGRAGTAYSTATRTDRQTRISLFLFSSVSSSSHSVCQKQEVMKATQERKGREASAAATSNFPSPLSSSSSLSTTMRAAMPGTKTHFSFDPPPLLSPLFLIRLAWQPEKEEGERRGGEERGIRYVWRTWKKVRKEKASG